MNHSIGINSLKFFIYLFLFQSFLSIGRAREISDEAFIRNLEIKLKQREGYIQILRSQGPEAYLNARGLNLEEDQKKIFVRDLVKIMNKKEAPKVYVDKIKKVLVVEDEIGKSEFEISLLKTGVIKDNNGKEHFILDKNYSELRKLF